VTEAAEGSLDKETVREAVYGMPYGQWKAQQPPATPEQLAQMDASMARNKDGKH